VTCASCNRDKAGFDPAFFIAAILQLIMGFLQANAGLTARRAATSGIFFLS
jgi:hypothetical protein